MPDDTKPWPTELNPCPKYGQEMTPKHERHKHGSVASNWDVMGTTTQVCNCCVWEREAELGSRRAAVDSFNPNLAPLQTP